MDGDKLGVERFGRFTRGGGALVVIFGATKGGEGAFFEFFGVNEGGGVGLGGGGSRGFDRRGEFWGLRDGFLSRDGRAFGRGS